MKMPVEIILFTVVVISLFLHKASFADSEENTAYNYYEKFGIPLAEKIKEEEEEIEANSLIRVVGGSKTSITKYAWQAGLLSKIEGFNVTGICGGSLIKRNRVITAAHCKDDGVHRTTVTTIVLGSTFILRGGTRLESTHVVMHPDWNPETARNDIAIIYLPTDVELSDKIQPISLPPDSLRNKDFVGERALASGFGFTKDNGTFNSNQSLSFVWLPIITNAECSNFFPKLVHETTICTSGEGVHGVCVGDSGGPLVVFVNQPILIGITSFGKARCESGKPNGFTRVTFYLDWIKNF